jgi:hypothetical protein
MIAASWPWDWSSSAWSALTFVILVLAAVLTWRQVKEAQRVREEQSRPFVLIDFHTFSTVVEFRIKNIGSTLARDVRFLFDQPLETTLADQNWNPADLNIFKTGMPSLAPGKEVTVLFDQFPARIEKGLPLTYRVAVTYTDSRGKNRYEEPIVLDMNMYVGTGGVHQDGLHEIHRQLKDLAADIHRWTDSSGLKIVTSRDQARRAEEWRALQAEREADAADDEEQDGVPAADEDAG